MGRSAPNEADLAAAARLGGGLGRRRTLGCEMARRKRKYERKRGSEMRNWGEMRSREGGVWMGRTREENEGRREF